MRFRVLGRTGISVSEIGFGCGSTGGLLVRGERADQLAAVEAALEGGINYFDTAAAYGGGRSEENLGEVLAALGADDVVLGTKFRIARGELADADRVVERRLFESLGRLGRTSVAMFTFHGRAVRDATDDGLTVDEITGPVADAMGRLVERGLARGMGFTGLGDTTSIRDILASGRFDAFQCYYNILNQSAARPGSSDGAQDFNGVLEVAADRNLAAIGIRVLSAAALSSSNGRHPNAGPSDSELAAGNRYEIDRDRAEAFRGALAPLGLSNLVELGIRFALSETRLSTVLLGFSDADQVREALEFALLGPLDDYQLAGLISR